MQFFPRIIVTLLLGLSVPASVGLVLRTAHGANDPAGKTSQPRASQSHKPQAPSKQSTKSSAKTKTSTVKDFIPSEKIAADQAVAFPVDM